MTRQQHTFYTSDKSAWFRLTRGKLAVIDSADMYKVGQHKWCATNIGNIWYAQSRISGKVRYLHHFLLGKFRVDHKDGDGLNNRRKNLRRSTKGENQRNRGKQKNNTSGFKGVYWNHFGKCWESKIGFRNKSIFLGLFDTPKEAAQAYDKAAKRLHKSFARLNFI